MNAHCSKLSGPHTHQKTLRQNYEEILIRRKTFQT